MRGTLRKFYGDRGYGLILTDVGRREVFCHITNFPASVLPRDHQPGTRLEFELALLPSHRPSATNIKILKD
jgi:cold shock CspA family protein